MARPTVADVANRAGVSVATVDRVLNARHPVREATARLVHEAARELDYHGAGLIAQRLADLPRYRLGFVLQRPNQSFYKAFAQQIEAAATAATDSRVSAEIVFAANQTPQEVVQKLEAVAKVSDAVAMVAIDHPAILAAVTRLQQAGKPVFSLLSDFAPGIRTGYLGLDNRKSGRVAAWFIARMARPGKVAIFVGSHRFHGHEMREIGLRSYFREHAPDFEVLDARVSLEDRALAHEATLDLLSRESDLVGLQIAGGGTEGILDALRNEKMAGRLVVVGNELTPETSAALADGVLTVSLATPLERLCRETVAQMSAALAGGTNIPGQIFLPFDIHLAESI